MEMTKIKVKIRLLEDMLGTVPADPDIHATYIATKAPAGTDTSDEGEGIPPLEDKGKTIFMQDENGLYILNYMIQGFLKEAGPSMGKQLEIKQMKDKLTKFSFIRPRKLYLSNKPKADGNLSRPLRAQTMQGPRVTIANSDYVSAGTEIDFEVHLLDGNPEVTPNVIREILEYGQYKGLGQWRSGGFGCFEVVEFDVLNPKTPKAKAEPKKKSKKDEPATV